MVKSYKFQIVRYIILLIQIIIVINYIFIN